MEKGHTEAIGSGKEGEALTRGSHADGLRDESHAGSVSHCNGTEIVRWNPFPQRIHTGFLPDRLGPTLSLAGLRRKCLRGTQELPVGSPLTHLWVATGP